MRHRVIALAVLGGFTAAAVLVAAPGSAGPEKISFMHPQMKGAIEVK